MDTQTEKYIIELLAAKQTLTVKITTLENKLFLLEQNYATLYKRVNSELGEDLNALNE